MNRLPDTSVKHSAAGPYLGFALQPVRLCYYLLCSPDDASVSLEYLDDVAVHNLDGTVLVEQCKSSLSHNALADWSSDLWKTVANWLEAVHSQRIESAKTTFQLYVTPTHAGKISAAMHAAVSAEDVVRITKQVKAKLKKTVSDKCKPHLERFVCATAAERHEVITRMHVASIDRDPLDAIRALLRPTVANSQIDIICQSAIGMAKEWADRCIRRDEIAMIRVMDFRKAFHAFVQRNNMPGILPSFLRPSLTIPSLFLDRYEATAIAPLE